VETDNEGDEPVEKFEHFEGFSYMGEGDFEVGSGSGDGDGNDAKPSEDGEMGVGAGGVTLKVKTGSLLRASFRGRMAHSRKENAPVAHSAPTARSG